MDKHTLVKVTNRMAGTVGYTIPDLGNLHRDFAPEESKDVEFEELLKLSYVPGGMVLLEDYLIIEDEEARAEILPNVEPEYHYKKGDIIEMLRNGSLDAFQDMLDFAPEGVIEICKQAAIEMPLTDLTKINAIRDKTGFDVLAALDHEKQLDVEEEAPVAHTRRVAIEPTNVEQTPTRRTAAAAPAPSKYKVVNKK